MFACSVDPAGAQPHHAVAARASAVSCVTSTSVVPRLRVAGEQQIDDLLAGVFVEIAGRLVGDQDRRIGRQRARERDALLLAAGKFRRIMVQPLAEADRREFARARAHRRRATPASSSGTATFSSAVMVGIRWNDWKTMPTLRPRKRASASSSSCAKVLAGDRDRAGVGPLQPRHDHQQRRFARAGRADQADRLAAPYMQVDIFEDMNAGRALPEREIDAGQAQWPVPPGERSFMWLTVRSARSYGSKGASWSSVSRRFCCSRLLA